MKEELTREVNNEVAGVLDYLLHCNASCLQRLWLDQHCLQHIVAASDNANSIAIMSLFLLRGIGTAC